VLNIHCQLYFSKHPRYIAEDPNSSEWQFRGLLKVLVGVIQERFGSRAPTVQEGAPPQASPAKKAVDKLKRPREEENSGNGRNKVANTGDRKRPVAQVQHWTTSTRQPFGSCIVDVTKEWERFYEGKKREDPDWDDDIELGDLGLDFSSLPDDRFYGMKDKKWNIQGHQIQTKQITVFEISKNSRP
jgi:hypothetical protein